VSCCLLSVRANAQAWCTNATLNGTYFYLVNGPILSTSGASPWAELGKFTADGKGNVSGGQSFASLAGGTGTYTFTGTYSLQADCTGTLTLSYSGSTPNQTYFIQLAQEGQSAFFAFSSPHEVVGGHIYPAASRGTSQCGNTSFSGSYGYLFAGVIYPITSGAYYSNEGQVVTDGKGNISSSGYANIGAGAFSFAANGTYSISGDCSGTVQLTSATGTSNFAIALAEGGRVLFMDTDPGNTVSGTAELQLVQSVLPQFVFGGAWYSALYFTNTTGADVSFWLYFTADDGTPLAVPALGGASMQVTVPALGSAIVEAPNGGTQSQGYATFVLPAGVSGYGVFRQIVPGRTNQEAVVPFATANANSSTMVFDDTISVTGVAIANAGPAAASISITVWDNNGTVLGTSTVTLQPNHNTTGVLSGFPGLSGVSGHRGRVQFAATSGNVAVLGLRFTGGAVTSIPATQP